MDLSHTFVYRNVKKLKRKGIDMGHFYGEIQGNRGEATRMGTKSSGFVAHIRGWNVGCRVVCDVDEDGYDVIDVYKTKGSNDYGSSELISTLKEKDLQEE